MQTIEAIYQNGVFRPLTPVPDEIVEGQIVVMTIQDLRSSADEIMRLADNIYEGLSEEDIDEIERIALDRSNFFWRQSYVKSFAGPLKMQK